MKSSTEKSFSRDERVLYDVKISNVILVPHIILMMFAIGFVTIWKPIIAKFTTHLCITNKKVIGKVGLIKTKTMESPLSKIDNVAIKQGLFGKIFNYGTVQIITNAGTYDYDYIKNPNEFKTRLMNQIEEFEDERFKKQASAMLNSTER